MNETIIRLEKVWKTYKMGKVKVHALKGVDISIKKGEFLVIVGKSGSGKSTIMNLIGCLDKPTQGSVYLDQKNIAMLDESMLSQIRGRKIGFIFQQFNLIPTLNAVDNVALPGEFQNKDLRQRAETLLSQVEMGERKHHKPTQLSGGQMQRVAIARALINNPEVVLADEPTGALDSKTGEQVITLLQKLNKEEGKCIVIVTHDQSLTKHADRVIELKDGEVFKEYTNRRKEK